MRRPRYVDEVQMHRPDSGTLDPGTPPSSEDGYGQRSRGGTTAIEQRRRILARDLEIERLRAAITRRPGATR